VTTRAGLRAKVRQELNDSGVPQLWLDLQLDEWVLQAIRDYGRHQPKEASQTIASVADQADYNLAGDCQRVARVEHPTGFFRVPDPLSAGDVTFDDPSQVKPLAPMQLSYEVWGPQGARVLTLRPAPADASDNIKVRYLASWAEPSLDADVLATPAPDDQLLVWYCCARALAQLGTDESKRQRWERDRGASVQGQAFYYRGLYDVELERRAKRAAPRRLVVRG
jgi:hypothetical protein